MSFSSIQNKRGSVRNAPPNVYLPFYSSKYDPEDPSLGLFIALLIVWSIIFLILGLWGTIEEYFFA